MASRTLTDVPRDSRMPEWLATLSPAARLWLQAGFAGLVAVVFLFLVWVVTAHMQSLQSQLADQAREDRALYREEMRLYRAESRELATELRSAVEQMKRAVDRLDQHSPSPRPTPP